MLDLPLPPPDLCPAVLPEALGGPAGLGAGPCTACSTRDAPAPAPDPDPPAFPEALGFPPCLDAANPAVTRTPL